jgi:hypothetical protein
METWFLQRLEQQLVKAILIKGLIPEAIFASYLIRLRFTS